MVEPGLAEVPPERGFLQAWEQGTMWPQAHPGKGWHIGSRAWETGIGLKQTLCSGRVRGDMNGGPVGRTWEVTGRCDTGDQPVAISPTSELFGLTVCTSEPLGYVETEYTQAKQKSLLSIM